MLKLFFCCCCLFCSITAFAKVLRHVYSDPQVIQHYSPLPILNPLGSSWGPEPGWTQGNPLASAKLRACLQAQTVLRKGWLLPFPLQTYKLTLCCSGVLDSYCCYNKLPQICCLRVTQIYYL